MALLAICTAGAGPVLASDPGDCCADLEERVTELEAMAASKGNRKVSLTISGLITWPIMVWDDGRESGAFVVSNDIKRPRFRFAGAAKIDAKWSASYTLEIGPNPSPLAPMDQHAFDGSGGPMEVRLSTWAIKNADFGQISFGLQSQATDTATESTTANTTSVISPGLPLMLGFVKRGFFMRRADGTLTGLRFGDFLLHGRTDIWGEGHRWDTARYDTPVWNGFSLAASWGEDDAQDAAIRYLGQIGRIKIASALGIAKWTDPGGQRGCAKLDGGQSASCWEIGGSLSLMDVETGLFVNAAAGYGKDNHIRPLFGGLPGIDDSEDFYFLVAGIERQWLSLGTTTVFGQYWHKDAGAGVYFTGGPLDATPLGANAFISGADVTIYGASLVQTLGEGIDLYVSLNRTETEVRTSATGAAKGSVTTRIEPFDFLLAGMAMRF
jgi:Gram-negative porin